MTTPFFDFYGIGVQVHADSAVARAIGRHFEHWARQAHRTPDIRVELRSGEPKLDFERTLADQVFERGVVYNRGRTTWVDHHGAALTRYDFETESGLVVASSEDDLVELGYLMIHARVGAKLEHQGLVRLHCLGLAVADGAVLILSPSGGGKSRLALAALERDDCRLLGDDLVLIDRSGRVHPFPSPVGASDPARARHLGAVFPFARRLHPPKWLLGLAGLEEHLCFETKPARAIVIASRASAPPSRVEEASRRIVARALFRDLVIGLGLPQVVELVARHGARDLWRQAPSVARRSAVAAALVAKTRGYALELADPEAALEAVLEEVR